MVKRDINVKGNMMILVLTKTLHTDRQNYKPSNRICFPLFEDIYKRNSV